MAIHDDVNDILNSGGGAPPISWKEVPVGTFHKGTVLAAEPGQVTDYKTREPQFYSDGKPKRQVVVTLKTDERDPAREDDDGVRRLYIKGQMLHAWREAVKAANPPRFEQGGTLAVKLVGREPSPNDASVKFNKFAVAYKPPSPTASVDDMLADDSPAEESGPSVEDLV